MESFELADPWGQLVSVEGNKEERIPICGDQFTIGRANDTDLVLAGNKYVSSRHCTMQLDEEGVVWLQDTSTNGTLVNGAVVKKDKIRVPHKAIIKLVFRKDSNDTQNVAYQFHDLRSKSSSDNAEFDSDATLDMTLPFDEEDGKDKPMLVGMKRQATEVIEEVTQPKKVAEEKEEKDKTEEGTAVDTTKPALEKKDSIAEALICQICQEILHDCVSLQPCMHSYCGGCYSEWMPYSNRCPTCRKRAQNVSQNHIVRNLVDAYLRTHPEKRRPDDDLKELDDKNRVKKDMCVRVVTEEEEEDEEGYGSDDDDVSRDSTPEYDNILDLLVPSWPSPTPNHLRIVPHGRGVGFQPITHPPPTLCRECPGFNPAVISSTDSPAASYTCPPSGNHILCQCCFECMPDRRNETDITVPAQKCNVCGQFYCHMYWSCRKIGCTGCLNKFKDMIFPPVVMDQIINNNPYESRILKNYLPAEGSSLQDMLQICLVKLDSGEYHCSDSRSSQASSETIICYKCALKNFRDLAYLYREDIPIERLPIEVSRRSNCYYGNNCRTQQHNPGHAERFNHICSQTKF